ncbi:hypothetical protein CDAR_519031 [Caerostris darwini]|uniref:Uncharacterized protein n=1 Tax=Caerostris darwini TaxID=1538125 RepID=A0AAV4PT70_9ARAC|nr:hypothetical protein CDAR_519031 [Caerostris darwini]
MSFAFAVLTHACWQCVLEQKNVALNAVQSMANASHVSHGALLADDYSFEGSWAAMERFQPSIAQIIMDSVQPKRLCSKEKHRHQLV